MARGGRSGQEGEEPHTQTQGQGRAECQRHSSPTSSGSQRRELRQQEGRMPHCLKEGVLFLISIPRALSPGRNKAPAPHWIEHTATQRRDTWWLKPGGRELLLREKKRIQKRKEPMLTLQRRQTRLRFITRETVTAQGILSKTKPLNWSLSYGCDQTLLFRGWP